MRRLMSTFVSPIDPGALKDEPRVSMFRFHPLHEDETNFLSFLFLACPPPPNRSVLIRSGPAEAGRGRRAAGGGFAPFPPCFDPTSLPPPKTFSTSGAAGLFLGETGPPSWRRKATGRPRVPMAERGRALRWGIALCGRWDLLLFLLPPTRRTGTPALWGRRRCDRAVLLSGLSVNRLYLDRLVPVKIRSFRSSSSNFFNSRRAMFYETVQTCLNLCFRWRLSVLCVERLN